MITSDAENEAIEEYERKRARQYRTYKQTIIQLMANKEKIFIVYDEGTKAEVRTLDECIKKNSYSIYNKQFFYDKKDAEYNAKILNYFYILRNILNRIECKFDSIERKIVIESYFTGVKNEKGESEYITRVSGKKKDLEIYENIYNRYYPYFLNPKYEIYNILKLMKEGIYFDFPIEFLYDKQELDNAKKYYNEYLG